MESSATQEYEPQVTTSPDTVTCSSLPYEPYTPSKKTLKNCEINKTENLNINYLECNEDTYSPKPLLDEGVNDSDFNASIPQYTPAPINDRKKYKENNNFNVLKETASERNSLGKQTSKQYKRVECEYIPEGQAVTTCNVPVYIPTPIDEITHKLRNRDKIRALRKRSNTIDVFEDQLKENDKDTQKFNGGSKYRPQRCLKKRSMTIDEIPAEFLDMPAYIPAPLTEKTIHSIDKTDELKNNEDGSHSNYIPLNRNGDKTVSVMVANDPTLAVTKISTPTAENSIRFHIIHKSKENKPRLAATGGETGHDAPDFKKPTKNLQPTNSIYSDRDLKTKKEKSSSSKKKSNNSPPQLLPNQNHVAIQNFKRIPKLQRKENDLKPQIKNKQSLDYVSSKDGQGQVFPKRDCKMEDHAGMQALKKCRRSERSPHKPKRLTEEQGNSLNKSGAKNHKSSLNSKELFGTDDEDDVDPSCKNINKIFSTPKNVSASKDSNKSDSSQKKKYKRDGNSEAGRDRKQKPLKNS